MGVLTPLKAKNSFKKQVIKIALCYSRDYYGFQMQWGTIQVLLKKLEVLMTSLVIMKQMLALF